MGENETQSTPLIVGICRFSYVATRGWNETVVDDVLATAAKLFEPERMETRFRFFEKICLPSVAAQTDKNFLFVIMVSGRMPDAYRARLDALVAPYANVVVQPLRARPMTDAVRIAVRRSIGDHTGPVVQFCLDDDDGLSVNYIAHLRAMAQNALSSGFGDRRPIALNHPRGITLMNRGGTFVYHENYAPFLALGLAVITDADISTTPYHVPHLKTATRMLAISDPEPITYLRGLHGHHDSLGISKGRKTALSEERLREVIGSEFPYLSDRDLTDLFDYEAQRAVS